jgi:hypothetical protein
MSTDYYLEKERSFLKITAPLCIYGYFFNIGLPQVPQSIAWHRHRGNSRRHRHSGMPNFSPVPD